MAKITLTVDIDGNAVSREYEHDLNTGMTDVMSWGLRVENMLDTLEKSQTIPF